MVNYPFVIFLALISFIGTSACKYRTHQLDIATIEVRNISPLMGETFYRIYYLDELVMYQSQYRHDSFLKESKFDSSTNRFSDNTTLLSSQWKSSFFVFHKDSSYGYNYDSYRNTKDNFRVQVDSTVKFITGTNRYDSFLTVKPDTVIWNIDKTELKEVYVFPKKTDMPTGRLVFYYSKKLNLLKESFNRVMDSAKKMKLFKTESLFNEFYSEKDKRVWPPMRNMTEMKEVAIENSPEIMRYFSRYKKVIGR